MKEGTYILNKEELILNCIELSEIIIHPQKAKQLSIFLKKKLTYFGLLIEKEFPTNDDKNTHYTIKATHHGSVAKKPIFFICPIDSSINAKQNRTTDSDRSSYFLPATGHSVIVLLEVIRSIKEHDLPTGPIEFIFTFSDHDLAIDQSLDTSLIDNKFGYILDAFSSLGNCVTTSSFIHTFEVKVTKERSFSNLMKENDCSASDIVNRALAQIPIEQIDKKVFVTIEPLSKLEQDPIVERQISLSGTIYSTSNHTAHLFLHKINTSFQQICKEMGLFYEMDIHKVTTGFHLEDSSLTVSTVKKTLQKIKQPFIETAHQENYMANLLNGLRKETLTLSIGFDKEGQPIEISNLTEGLLNATKFVLLLIEHTPS